MIPLTVYSRPGCHLCEELVEELLPLVRGQAEVSVVDIDTDRELQARYGVRIPVVVCGAEELSGFPLNRAAILDYFRSRT